MTAKNKVIEWIHKNLAYEEVKLKDFKNLPGGTLVIDLSGKETIVYYDYLNQEVRHT